MGAIMRCAAIVILCMLASCASAQNPEEYPVVMRNALVPQGEFLIPAPAGWDAACIGLRNIPAQHLATIDYFNDSLKSFAQTGLPQITLYDAVFTLDSTHDPTHSSALYIIASVHNSFCLYRVTQNRAIEKIATLVPGENDITPERCSLELIGASTFSKSSAEPFASPEIFLLAHFHDAPLRHVIASYTTDGAAQWQFALGGEAVHVFFTQSVNSASPLNIDARIIFSTDASPRESADTLHINANKSYIGALTSSGRLLWTTLLGGAGTTSWCIPIRSALYCAAARDSEGEMFVLDQNNGVTQHFRRIAGHLIPKTLCALWGDNDKSAQTIAFAELPSTIVEYDSVLRDVRQTSLEFPIDSSSTLIPIQANQEHDYMLFTWHQSHILTEEFHLSGVSPEGMEYERTGINRFSGTLLRNGKFYCAQTAKGGELFALISNPVWWWYRYRVNAAIAAVFLALLFGAYALAKKYLFYRTYYNQLVRSSATTGIIALNRQQRAMYLNNAARELLHIAPYLPLRRHVSEYIPHAVYADLAIAIRDCLLMRRGYENISTIQEGAQSKTYLNRVRPTISRGGALQGCIVQVEDVTHTIERERLLNWASVAHHIAHEMKTPIGTVMLNAQHLQKSEDDLPLNLRKYLLRIITQSGRLSEILQTFLRIARFNAMNLIAAPIAPLVQQLAADYAEMLPTDIVIQCTVSNANARASFDAEQLTTALRNILDNAVNAIKPKSGVVTITVASRSSSAGRFVVIAIRDTGKGMSETCRARVFEPFYTETPGGSGIGMMIVKRIIEEHHGAVELDSELGNGTEVRVILPEETTAE